VRLPRARLPGPEKNRSIAREGRVSGGSIIVQHYVKEVAEKHRVRLVSLSDTFSPNGQTKVQVI
jgi:hypothetical protein